MAGKTIPPNRLILRFAYGVVFAKSLRPSDYTTGIQTEETTAVNLSIGLLGDDLEGLQKAIDYLKS